MKATNTGDSPAEARLTAERIGPGAGAAAGVFLDPWPRAPWRRSCCGSPFAPMDDPAALDQEDPKLWLDRTVEFWRGDDGPAARIEVPCRKANEALLAAHVCQLIANDHGELHGGEGFYDEFYIRDGGLPGHGTRGGRPVGRRAQGRRAATSAASGPTAASKRRRGQFDANGQALWVLWQYYKITGDRAWLERVYPQMRRAVDWIDGGPPRGPGRFALRRRAAGRRGRRRVPLGRQAPHRRLRPLEPARPALHGRRRARSGKKPTRPTSWPPRPTHYRAAIDAAWKRTGLAHFPPSWEKEGTHWGNTETLWPTRSSTGRSSRRARRSTHVRHVTAAASSRARSSGWGGPTRSIPTCRPTRRWPRCGCGEHEQVVEDFYWYLLHSTAAHAFPEGIFFKRRFAWSDTIPARHRGVELRRPAPPHADPRARRRTAPAGGRARLVAGARANRSASSGRRRTSAS